MKITAVISILLAIVIPLFTPEFVLANEPMTIGINAYGLANFGYGDIYPDSLSSDIDDTLAETQRMGGKVIRIFLGNNLASDSEVASRLDALLTKAERYGISIDVALISSMKFGADAQFPPSMASYYTVGNGSPYSLNRDFYTGGYQDGYMSYLRTVVTTNKHHSNIYAWEPGNEMELGDFGDSQNLINFMNDAASTIKSIDSNHKVATGFSSVTNYIAADTIYPAIKNNYDILTIHPYPYWGNGRKALRDVEWANSNGKTIIVEEDGIYSHDINFDRTPDLKVEIEFWKSRGINTFLHWGFMKKGRSPFRGSKDQDFGIDSYWHGDYDQHIALYQSYASGERYPDNCDSNKLKMSFSPSISKVGDTVNFSLSGDQGYDKSEDYWSGGVDCKDAFFNNKSCQAIGDGTFTWTHKWKVCTTSGCPYASQQCSQTLTYTIAPAFSKSLQAPKNLSGLCTNNQLQFSWDKVASASAYSLYIDDTANKWQQSNLLSGDSIEASLSAITFKSTGKNSHHYNWWVYALDSKGSYSKATNGSQISCLNFNRDEVAGISITQPREAILSNPKEADIFLLLKFKAYQIINSIFKIV